MTRGIVSTPGGRERQDLTGVEEVRVGGVHQPGPVGGDQAAPVVADLAARGVAARSAASVDQIVAWVATEARAGDEVVVMSNGGFGGIHGRLLEALAP
jgi:UDP-N-acetylmuramate: L-alanyl-gamma-D-glutamyl-meso-diaminopimelate ligase